MLGVIGIADRPIRNRVLLFKTGNYISITLLSGEFSVQTCLFKAVVAVSANL